MQSEIHQNCPQCGNLIVGSAKRLIKDSCGHEKCRVCLLSEVDGCRRCLGNQNSKNSVDEVKTSHVDDFFARDNHATVITYNNLYDNQKDLNAEQGETEHSLCEQAKLHVDTVLNEAESTCLATTCTTFVKKKSKATLTKRNYKAISIPNHISIEGEPSLFKCNICSSKFRTKGHIKYHIYCVGGKKPYSCDVCFKTFILKSQLHIHQLMHFGSRPYVCKICGGAFRESGKLNRHMVLHSDEKPHICDECAKCFKTKSSLKFHRLTHTGEKPFSCIYCEKRFNNSSNLKKHMVSHSDDKTHMCEQCGKKFKQKWALTVHRRSHFPVRNYTCEVCERTFINYKDLKRHESIHLDTKMYSCGLCAISFRRKDNLGRHIRNAHPDKKAEIIKNFSKLPKFVMKPVVDNPNAIKVITASPIAKKDENNKVVSTSRICINGPLKLALKTSAFKRNYNINRDCILESNSRGDILHVSSSKTHKNHYRDVEKPHDSLQTEQTPSPRIFPSVYSTPNLSADEFYANRPYVIKNIKFKIPDNYPFRNESLLKAIIPQIQSRARGDECTEESGSHGMSMVNKSNSLEVSNNNDHTGLRHNLKNVSVVATSVIVNSSNQKNIHWRRRMSQNIVSEKI